MTNGYSAPPQMTPALIAAVVEGLIAVAAETLAALIAMVLIVWIASHVRPKNQTATINMSGGAMGLGLGKESAENDQRNRNSALAPDDLPRRLLRLSLRNCSICMADLDLAD